MGGRSTLLGALLMAVVCTSRLNAYEDTDEDVNDSLSEKLAVRPLGMLKERRGLDYCKTNPNPCENSGVCCSAKWCTKEGDAYSCRCKGDYAGHRCQHKCPLKECWNSFYTKIYSSGQKRSITGSACREQVETLDSCLKSGLKSHDACNCDEGDLLASMYFDKQQKDFILEKQCGGASGGCVDKEVDKCVRKIYAVEGAIDSGSSKKGTNKCSLVNEAISCMKALSGNEFKGCLWMRNMFTEKVAIRQIQWRTWCMGKFCSLFECGSVKIPRGCSGDSVRGVSAPVMKCMKDKIQTCVPKEASSLAPNLEQIHKELEESVTEKCHLHKQVRDMCHGKKDTRSLQARDLLRALLEQTLTD